MFMCTYCTYACVHRGLAVGIYTTSNPEDCHFVADNCKANVIVVENQIQLDKILEVSVAVMKTYFCTSRVECRGLPASAWLPMSVCMITNICLPGNQCLHVCLEPMSVFVS